MAGWRDLLARLDDPASPAAAPGDEAALRAALAAAPLQADPWLDLGRLLWQRATSQRDPALRREAEACVDLGRLLRPPGEPALTELERVGWARLGQPVAGAEPTTPEATRRALLAALVEPPADVPGLFAASTHLPPVTRWTLAGALARRLGDAEELARLRESLAGEPTRLAPAWLAAGEEHRLRELLAPLAADLRRAWKRQPLAMPDHDTLALEAAAARTDLGRELLASSRLLPEPSEPTLEQLRESLTEDLALADTSGARDAKLLGAVDRLLRLDDPRADALVDELLPTIDGGYARALAELWRAASLAGVDPDSAAAIALAAERRLRRRDLLGPATWPARLEAARLLARLGRPEGDALLAEASVRLLHPLALKTTVLGRWHLARALAERPGPPALVAAVADSLPRGGWRWLARVAAGLPVGLPGRPPAGLSAELATLRSCLADPSLGPLRDAVVAAMSPDPALRFDRRRPAWRAWLEALREGGVDGLAAVADLATAEPTPPPAARWLLLSAVVVEDLIAGRAESVAERAEERLRVAWREALTR